MPRPIDLSGGLTETLRHEVDGVMVIRHRQRAEGVVAAVKDAREHIPKDKALGVEARYVGSIPIVLAQVWAQECGHPIGTKAFMAYAKKKLQDIDNRKLLVARP